MQKMMKQVRQLEIKGFSPLNFRHCHTREAGRSHIVWVLSHQVYNNRTTASSEEHFVPDRVIFKDKSKNCALMYNHEPILYLIQRFIMLYYVTFYI